MIYFDADGNVNLTATEGDLTVRGSNVEAGQDCPVQLSRAPSQHSQAAFFGD